MQTLNVTLFPMCLLVEGYLMVMHGQSLRLRSAADLHLWLASSARRVWGMEKNFLDSDDI